VLLAGALTGCVQYEYEEELYLKTDGSGEIYIHGSREVFASLGAVVSAPNPDLVTRAELERTYAQSGLDVVSIKRSRRDGRTFFHVRARFTDIATLSSHPAFRGRRYEFTRAEETLALRAEIRGGERVSGVPGVPRDELVGFRVHFPSPVRFHNSPTGLDRGNIVRWQQTVGGHLAGEPLVLEARFDTRTVLEATLLIFGSALVLVVTAALVGFYVTVRVGRRQLAAGGQV